MLQKSYGWNYTRYTLLTTDPPPTNSTILLQKKCKYLCKIPHMETPTPSLCADSSTNSMKCRFFHTFLLFFLHEKNSIVFGTNIKKNIVKTVVIFQPIMQFWCPSRFRILGTIHTHFILLPLWTITTCMTNLQAEMVTLWPTRPRGQSRWKWHMWHMVCDMWHVSHDMWYGWWTFSQNVSSLALMVQ